MSSESIQERIGQFRSHADRLAAVVARYPDAVFGQVPGIDHEVVVSDLALADVTGLHCATQHLSAVLVPYVDVGGFRVFALRNAWKVPAASEVFADLAKANPAAYAALLAAVKART